MIGRGLTTLAVLLAAGPQADAVGLRGRALARGRANPIRRVVTMLQDMQTKITAEGEKDQELFDKYICYCKTGKADLELSVQSAQGKMPEVTSALDSSKAQLEQLKTELASLNEGRTEAEAALAEAKALREKEAEAFAKQASDYKTNLKALAKAIQVLSTGSAGSFLQTSTAATLRRLSIDADLSGPDREVLTAFLSQGSGDSEEVDYAPQSGQIIGILKQMEETMAGDLKDLTEQEEKAKSTYAELVAAKEKELKVAGAAIEDKTARQGKVGVSIEELREELEDTSASYEEDKAFLADLEKNCATKESEYEVVKKTRAEELLALSETIKLLNDDDALDLFKSALPATSFMQVKAKSQAVKKAALKVIAEEAKNHKDTRLDLIALAMHSKGASFEKVLKMVDEMVALLKKEQGDDDSKKTYCEQEIDSTEDKLKQVDIEVSNLEKSIEETKSFIASTAEEIDALVEGIKALDKSVASATEQRKEENAEYKSTMATNNAAKELLLVAVNRLNQFYNPSLHKEEAPQELSEEDQIAVNFGGTPPPTEAPGGIAGTGIEAFVQVRAVRALSKKVAPAPPPEAVEAYSKKSQESNGVLTLINMLVADLDKDMQEMDVEEKDAQKSYEKFVADSADKRTVDSKSIQSKETAKAEAEQQLVKTSSEKKSKVEESYATSLILKDLHMECDWLLGNFQVRKDARSSEIDSLNQAKAILSGASFD
mmetsp:Transcript_16275/g.35252  ORF Transcript_16275/g.35252 Transcript_16275/m.35252 type:complete len:716 (+) Transcript_16275:111-2258(+)